MKICPECSAQYEDSTNFCANDGRSLTQKTIPQTRLCPHCANSIPVDAPKCTYCKAEVGSPPAPQWPTREGDGAQVGLAMPAKRFLTTPKLMLLVGVALTIVALLLIGKALLGPNTSSETRQLAEAKIKELQEKEEKIQMLEGQLAQVRQELTDSSTQMTALKSKLEESEKALAAARQRLEASNREIDRLLSRSAQSSPSPASRPVDAAPRPAPLPARRPAEPGIYETLRPTAVHEDPTTGSRVVSEIRKGTKVTVVRSVGEWLEVRSKHGNPPGFILRDDAMLIGKAN